MDLVLVASDSPVMEFEAISSDTEDDVFDDE